MSRISFTGKQSPGGRIIHVFEWRDEDITQADDLCTFSFFSLRYGVLSYVFMAQVLQQLEFSIRALREDRSAERLHDLLDGHGLAGELVLCRAKELSLARVPVRLVHANRFPRTSIPNQAKGTHSHGLQVSVPSSRSTPVPLILLTVFSTQEVK